MRREIAVALLAIQMALTSGAAQASYDKDQLSELNELLDRGDIPALVEFWNANIKDVSRRTSKVEFLLAELMSDIRSNGVGQINESLVEASNQSVSIY